MPRRWRRGSRRVSPGRRPGTPPERSSTTSRGDGPGSRSAGTPARSPWPPGSPGPLRRWICDGRLVMRRSWVRFPQAALPKPQVRALDLGLSAVWGTFFGAVWARSGHRPQRWAQDLDDMERQKLALRPPAWRRPRPGAGSTVRGASSSTSTVAAPPVTGPVMPGDSGAALALTDGQWRSSAEAASAPVRHHSGSPTRLIISKCRPRRVVAVLPSEGDPRARVTKGAHRGRPI
jgi:hypothetical protein